jgi:hypothetical protein
MRNTVIDPLSLREAFHLEFLRRLGAMLDPKSYAVKGGVNIRLFYNSLRYSEDLDLDVAGLPVDRLKSVVMSLLRSRALLDSLGSYGIRDVRPPDMASAKQTETTQRFKVHLLTSAGEDLFTKVEFSRRGFRGKVIVEIVPDTVLRPYHMTPLWVPHYDIVSTIVQKIEALASRVTVQARDIFDLHILISQAGSGRGEAVPAAAALSSRARERVYEVGFDVFRDTVLSYLSPEDRKMFDRPEAWDDIRLRVADFLAVPGGNHA